MENSYYFYIFFDVAAEMSALPLGDRELAKSSFVTLLSAAEGIVVESYATLGFKAGTTFMLLLRGPSPEAIQLLLRRLLLQSPVGRHLRITRALFGMPGRSTYVQRPSSQEKAITEGKRAPYLIVYPFTKTADWYMLSLETRKKLMAEHIRVGRTFPDIRQLLLYSFGVDDNEFIVSYETDSLENFRDLVMELRSTEVRKYTLNDQPVFTCSHRTLDGIAEFIFTP